jgi:hypothetical protein
MVDILSLGIGQSNLISAVVGRNINTTIGQGGVYNINRENRNNNLYDNLVDALKYGWTENGHSVLGVNIGEDAGINGYASWQKIIDSDSSLYNYTHNENGGRSVYGENDITKRIDNAIDIARYSIHVSQNYNRRIDYFNESERKFSEAYRMGEDSNVIDAGTGGNLNGRLQTLMGNVFGYDLYNLPDDPYVSHYNRIKTNTTVKSNLDKLAEKIGKIETMTIKDYIQFMPTVANYVVGSVSKLTTGDTEFEALDRLSELYKQSMDGVYKGTLSSVSSDLIKNIREARNIAFQNGSNYLQSVIDDGTFSKGNEFYGESKDYSNSISDSFVGNSIDSSSYSDRVSDVSTRYGQKTNISGNSLTNIQIYELYNEDRHIDPGDNVSVSEGGTYGDILELNGKSILKKTNDLFASGKIKSLISRFHTGIVNTDETTTAVDSAYGMSRGRNLRKANVTSHGGYDNPYCRVWTSMHQYSKMTDLIRPFSENGDFASFATTHKDLGGLRTASGATNLDAYSSIEKSGVAHIAPHSEEDVKKCMFSIENLAWKDINFNATIDGTKRTVLSKEQQGPNGGRIMWFPPYNLKFTENVGVQWEGNNFIGRGEQIYTYTNTDRSGTLNFTILVDHPSIIDRWSRKVGEINYSAEQELLRFFAGCNTLTMQESESKSKEEPEESGKTENGLSVDGTPDKKENADIERYYVFFPNDYSGIDDPDAALIYLSQGYNGTGGYERINGPLRGCIEGETYTCQNKNKGTNTWYYQPDKSLGGEILGDGNYEDTKTFGLNKYIRRLAFDSSLVPINGKIELTGDEIKEVDGVEGEGEKIRSAFSLEGVDSGTVFSFSDLFSEDTVSKWDPLEYDTSIEIKGYASSHGTTKSNHKLADNRAKVIKSGIEKLGICDADKIVAKVHESGSNEDIIQLDSTNKDINSFEAKLARCVEVLVKHTLKENTTPTMGSSSGGTEAKSEDRTEKVKQSDSQVSAKTSSASTTVTDESDSFDNEYQYFLTLDKEAPLIRKNIVNKVRYFDPAFHSITPEGFNARLTFLHQCTRQGPTTSVSDSGSESSLGAGNLSFGRPPICVLRIGDFYNTKIIIDSLSIIYETGGGVQWDMNQEGIGLQPMMADIAIGFKFLGGSDLSGPIARLQNAVSSNFYANTSVYDVRSDYRLSGDTKTMVWTPNFSEGTTNVEHKGYNF